MPRSEIPQTVRDIPFLTTTCRISVCGVDSIWPVGESVFEYLIEVSLPWMNQNRAGSKPKSKTETEVKDCWRAIP
jgi:hypothetical protein